MAQNIICYQYIAGVLWGEKAASSSSKPILQASPAPRRRYRREASSRWSSIGTRSCLVRVIATWHGSKRGRQSHCHPWSKRSEIEKPVIRDGRCISALSHQAWIIPIWRRWLKYVHIIKNQEKYISHCEHKTILIQHMINPHCENKR